MIAWILAVSLLDVPYVPQTKDTCGAASLAMVMRHWNKDVSHDEIARRLRTPALKGILGSHLEAFARERGLVAIAYAGDGAQLRDYLDKGRPLIVAWGLGRDRFHNVVVVGHDPETRAFIVHDPAVGASRRVDAPEFETRWAAAGHWTLLVLPPAVPDGLAAVDADRNEEAIEKLEAAPEIHASYEGLVGLAVAQGRLGRLDEAARSLEAAVRLDPGRPEARVERGGLRFLERRYHEAAEDLRAALHGREDSYTRDLLASTLLLLDRPVEAIETWNPLGKPRLQRLSIHGLVHTRDRVARRELRFREGETIDAGRLRASLRSLSETGVFAETRVSAAATKDRELDLRLLMRERRGFGHPVEILSTTVANLFVSRAKLRYTNIAGEGISARGLYWWEASRPRVMGRIDWARPLGAPVHWRVSAFRETQPYDVDGPFRHKARGVETRFRRVIDARSSAEIAVRWRRRTFDREAAYARPGHVFGAGLAFDHALVDTRRHRLEASVEMFAARADVRYASSVVSLAHRWTTSGPTEGRLPTSVFATRALWGRGSSGMPIDQMFMPGAAPDAEYPLRGHHLRRRGVLGLSPIGREIRLLNVEWRREVWDRPLFGAGLTFFHDMAHVPVGVTGPQRVLFDLGLGIRFRFGSNSLIRVDYGRDLRGGGHAWTFSVDEAF